MENNDQLSQAGGDVTLKPAHPLKRLANYIIDFVVFSILLSFLLTALAKSSVWINTLLYNITTKPDAISLMDQFLIWFVYGLFSSITEALLKGKTIGKYLTGTRAVMQDGGAISSEIAFTRGLIRIIPFEQFSAIGFPCRPWHDRWSKTIVIDERMSVLRGK